MSDVAEACSQSSRDSPSAERILGILGGMGPLATAHFYVRLVERTGAMRDQDHPRVLLFSDSQIPDRTQFLVAGGPSPIPALADGASRLREAGASLVVIPCNSASVLREEIQQSAKIDIFDWIGAAVDEVVTSGHSPVGILATSGTLSSGQYQRALEKLGFQYVLPGDSDQASLMDAIYGPQGVKTLSTASGSAIAQLQNVIETVTAAGAKSLLLGCTELPILVARMDRSSLPPIIDPSETAIRGVLRWFESTSEHGSTRSSLRPVELVAE